MDVDPWYTYIEKFRGGLSWYMMESKHFISHIDFKLKNQKGNLVSFKGQSITFSLSIKEVWKWPTLLLLNDKDIIEIPITIL